MCISCPCAFRQRVAAPHTTVLIDIGICGNSTDVQYRLQYCNDCEFAIVAAANRHRTTIVHTA